jgi:hypothetical protein
MDILLICGFIVAIILCTYYAYSAGRKEGLETGRDLGYSDGYVDGVHAAHAYRFDSVPTLRG